MLSRIIAAFLFGFIIGGIYYTLAELIEANNQVVRDMRDGFDFANMGLGAERVRLDNHTHLEDGSVYIPDQELVSALRISIRKETNTRNDRPAEAETS